MKKEKSQEKKNSKSKKLDQFYTNPTVAKYCYEKLKSMINLEQYSIVLEPSAGDGSFFNLFPKKRRLGLDLDPKGSEIVEMNFFDYNPKMNNIITIGNPPFGKRSKLAIEFFNHATNFSDTIAFIVPLQWQKWSVHSKLNKKYRLVYDEKLPKDSFIFEGNPYDVRCCFQIWTKRDDLLKETNYRILDKPKISHEDFEMYLYNNTRQAEKFFYYDWDFAVPRQGYQDYNLRVTDEKECNRKIQWIFFKAKNKKILKRLKSIDFVKLSLKNTSTPGWGKADLIEEYVKNFE